MSDTQEYYNLLVNIASEDPVLSILTQENVVSKSSRWTQMLYTSSYLAAKMEELNLSHLSEIEYLIQTQKRLELDYYRKVAFNYRDGHDFNTETLEYAEGYTEEQIEQARIVKRSAAIPVSLNGRLVIDIKLATEDLQGNLTAIEQEPLERIKNHLFINGDTGVNIRVSSNRADELKMELNVYINPQILTLNGDRVDGIENQVVPNAINQFFKDENFKFDGELVLSLLADRIQSVQGVQDRSVSFKHVEANFQIPEDFQLVHERYTSYSGYFTIRELTINYLVK